MNMIMKYLLFFIVNCVLTSYIFPEPSFARSLVYNKEKAKAMIA